METGFCSCPLDYNHVYLRVISYRPIFTADYLGDPCTHSYSTSMPRITSTEIHIKHESHPTSRIQNTQFETTTMVKATVIREFNSHFTNTQPQNQEPVCVFAGATSGIGAATLTSITSILRNPTLYILGRSVSRFVI